MAGIADSFNRHQTLAEKDRPGIELIVAFADTGESHHGGIYQAANFTYAGMSVPGRLFRHKATGRLLHSRAVSATGYRSHFGTVRKVGAGHQRRMSTELAQLKSVPEQVTLEMTPKELNELGKFGGPPETRTPDPLIKSQVQSGAERNIDKKAQPFRGPLDFSSAMGGACSAQVQAQNEHSR